MTGTANIRVERGHKRIRVVLGGEVVADTTTPLLVWEKPYYPTYYVPRADVVADALVPTGETRDSQSRGTAQIFTVKAGTGEAAGGAYAYPDSRIPELADQVAFRWNAMDHWFEEDEEVYVHARDPYTRVDALHSSRWIRVEIDGVTVAESTSPILVFETGLPVRHYLPKTDVRLDLLTPTDSSTDCPYKGTARYWSVTVDGTVHEDVVWSYPHPTREVAPIAGYVSFYDEKVDVYVDGELQDRPRTAFS